MASTALAGCADGEPTRPNVVIWMVDTLRADHLGCYGYARDTSPVMDGLAAQGVLFEQAHAHSNWTQPSVASILSGRFPPTFRDDFSSRCPSEYVMAAEWFAEHGYQTAGFTLTVATGARFGFEQGYETYEELDLLVSPRERKRRVGSGYDAERLVERAVAWLDGRARTASAGAERPGRRTSGQGDERPFFLYLHSVDPHLPYESHGSVPRFADDGENYAGPLDGSIAALERVRRQGGAVEPADVEHMVAMYDQEIAYNDRQLGRLLEELERRGLRDDTLVVVVSDHGEELWDRSAHGHGHMNLHRELTHVPWIMSWPRGLPSGVRIDGLVQAADILPTVAELAGLPVPPGVDGRSLAALLAGRGARARRGSDGDGPPDLRTTMVLVDRGTEPGDLGALRTPTLLYVFDPRGNRTAIYDLTVDPDERVDIAEQDPSLLEGWNERFAELRDQRLPPAGRADGDRVELDEEARKSLRELGYLR